MADRGAPSQANGATDRKMEFMKILPLLLILVPLVGHFVLACFVLLIGWLPSTFLFSHVFVFLTGAWIVHHRQSLIPIIMYIAVVAITVLMDVIQLGLYFGDVQDQLGGGDSTQARTWQFSAAMMIISLIMKPLTISLACVAAFLTSGSSLPFGLGGQRSTYNNVEGYNSPLAR